MNHGRAGNFLAEFRNELMNQGYNSNPQLDPMKRVLSMIPLDLGMFPNPPL